MELLTTTLLILILSYLLFISSRRPEGFPPGLRRIPLVGQMFRGSKPYLGLWKAHKIMGHFIGSAPAVTIQDFPMAKELFNKDEWCGRGQSIISRYFRSDNGVNKVNLSIRVWEMIAVSRASSPRMVSCGRSRGGSL